MSIRVSVDASGGDHGISVTIPAGISALKEISDLEIVFVGNEANIKSQIDKASLKTKFLIGFIFSMHLRLLQWMNSPLRHLDERKTLQ